MVEAEKNPIERVSDQDDVIRQNADLSLHPMKRLRQWIDKRIAKRQPISIPVGIATQDRVQPCILKDVSTTGFRLYGVAGLAKGERVEVRISDDETMVGQVAWSSSQYAGFKLLSTSIPGLIDRVALAVRSGIHLVPSTSLASPCKPALRVDSDDVATQPKGTYQTIARPLRPWRW
jgi:hypothetical protein